MFVSIIYETNLFYIVKQYLFNPTYRDNYLNSDINFESELNLFNVIKFELLNFDWTYDYMIIWGTNAFQFVLPILCGISALVFFKKNNTINKFIIYKQKNYKKIILKEINKKSLKLSFSLFLSFIIFCVISYIISNGNTNIYISRNFLLDLLPNNFYNNYTFIYYLLDGFVRLFFASYIYSFFACAISLNCIDSKKAFFTPIIYYFGLAMISMVLSRIFQPFIYLSPLLIMVTGYYSNINSILVFIVPIFTILFSLLIVYYKGRNIEI